MRKKYFFKQIKQTFFDLKDEKKFFQKNIDILFLKIFAFKREFLKERSNQETKYIFLKDIEYYFN